MRSEWLREEIGPDGFAYVGPQFIPGVALRENVEREALGAISTIGLLGDLEDQFGHDFIFALHRHDISSESGLLDVGFASARRAG